MNINYKLEEDTNKKEEEILEVFEDYLKEVDAVVPNRERDEAELDDPSENYSIIFGEDYYRLLEEIKYILNQD